MNQEIKMILMKKQFLILFVLVNSLLGFSQNRKIDSLVKLITIEKVDSQKVSLQSTLLSLYAGNSDSTNFFKTFREAYNLADNVNYTRGKVLLLIRKSNYYTSSYNREKGKEPLILAENILVKEKDFNYLGRVYFEYSTYYRYQDDYSTALKFSFKSLKINELIKDSIAMANCYGQIGNIYRKQKEFLKAKDFYIKAFVLDSIKKSEENYGVDLSNLGLAYSDLQEYEKAIYYLKRALVVKRNSSNPRAVPNTLNILGSTYIEYGKPKEALECLQEALSISKKLNEPKGIAISLINIAEVYQSIKEYQSAITYFKECIDYAKTIRFGDVLIEAYSELSKCYAATNSYDLAYKTHIDFTTLKDSMFNSNSSQQIIDMKTKYDTEKKEEENKLLQTENKLSVATIKQQKLLSYFIITVLVVVTLLAFFIFNGLKKQRKANHIIAEQKIIVEEKHKEITDSINYAERIQRSFLASKDLLDQNLKDYFVFFQPKDVVSGDFYWATFANATKTNGNKDLFYLVTADSTGHGVPGAIMSLLNITSIESAIKDGNTSPADILNATRKTIIERLKKDGTTEGGKDGMDCSLICFDFANNEFTYAAANNPVWVVRENQLIELAPDKMPVGKHDKDQISFTQKEFQLQKGDMVYTLTDGLPDQFGGTNGKKYKYKQLKELLISISGLQMEVQKEILNESFVNWKGNLEQVDDMCVIGIKL